MINKLSAAIEADPEKEVLYYNRGVLYQGKKDYVKATEDFKKAISIKEDYFDAVYNLGGMIFNQGADMINAANNIKNDAEYQKAKKKGEDKIKEALPYMEKAYELDPKTDLGTTKGLLSTLKQLYVRVNNTEKYNQMKAELEAIQAKK